MHLSTQEGVVCAAAKLSGSLNLSWRAQNVDIAAVLSELRRRFGVSGIDEKASRD